MNTTNKIIRVFLFIIAAGCWTGAAATHVIEGIVYAERDREVEWVCNKVKESAFSYRGRFEVKQQTLDTGVFRKDGTTCLVSTEYIATGNPVAFKGEFTKDRGFTIQRIDLVD